MPSLLINVSLPVYNEADQLPANVDRLVLHLTGLPRYRWEVVIVDNGSTDSTWPVAKGLVQSTWAVAGKSHESAGTPRAMVSLSALHVDSAGRGGALKAVWSASSADILSYMDIDLSTDLEHVPELIGAVADGAADIATGSRLLPTSRTTRGWRRELLSRGYNRLIRWLLGSSLRDHQCGFKAVSRRAARALLPQVQDNGFFFDTELLVVAQRQGWRIAEIPVRWVEDIDSRVRLLPTIIGDLRGIWRLCGKWSLG